MRRTLTIALVCLLLLPPAIRAALDWPSSIVLRVRDVSSEPYQVFFDRGAGFREEDSAVAPAVAETRSQLAASTIRVPRGPISRLRLDPPGIRSAAIRELCAANAFIPSRRQCWSGADLRWELNPLHDISRITVLDDLFVIESAGMDPYLTTTTGAIPSGIEQVRRVKWSEAFLLAGLCSLLASLLLRLNRARIRAAAQVVGMALTWTLVPLLAVELAMIAFEPWLFRSHFQYDPDLGFRIRSYSGGSNQFGFNSRDHEIPKPAGVYRIVVAGDSFNWEGKLDGNYTAIVGRLLQERFSGSRIDVIAAGYHMTHTVEQLAMMRKYGMHYEPDLVVLGFYTGNDFIDGIPGRRRIWLNDTYMDLDSTDPLPTLFGRPLIKGSRLLLFLRQRWMLEGAIETGPDGDPRIRDDDYLRTERARMLYCNRRLQEEGYFRDRTDFILGGVDGMRRLANENGAGFAVIILPAEYSVDPAVAERLLAEIPDPEEFDLDLAHEILQRHLETRGIPFIDLLDPLREAAQSHSLYLPSDGHFNDAGNVNAARLVFPFLSRLVEADGLRPNR